MRLLTRNEMKFLFYGGPIAIINTNKNKHDLVAIDVQMKEFFICEYGVYMVDTQTQYRYNKQPLSFYTSHGESIPKKIVKTVKNAYLKKNYTLIRKELEKIYPDLLMGVDYHNIYQVLYDIVKKTNHFAIDLNTEKYMPHMEAYNPQAINNLYHTGNEAVRAIDRLSPPRFPPKLFPIGLALMIGIISLAMIQNLPKWVRELNAEFGKGFGGGGFIIQLKQYIPEFIMGVNLSF